MNIEEIEKEINRLATFSTYGQIWVRRDEVLAVLKKD